jgi:biopolymer transport protein ExbD
VVTIISSGQIFTPEGLRKLPELGEWLRAQARSTSEPLLLVRAGTDVSAELLAEVASLARSAGFEMIWAAGDPVSRK